MILLDLLGGVALLLWGLHMVHSGTVRAFGSDLARLYQLSASDGNFGWCGHQNLSRINAG